MLDDRGFNPTHFPPQPPTVGGMRASKFIGLQIAHAYVIGIMIRYHGDDGRVDLLTELAAIPDKFWPEDILQLGRDVEFYMERGGGSPPSSWIEEGWKAVPGHEEW